MRHSARDLTIVAWFDRRGRMASVRTALWWW